MSLRPGDVVFGKFPVKSQTFDGTTIDVLRHYSVVLMANDEGALLAYTTSMKDDVRKFNPANRFTLDDLRMANLDKQGLWDASTCAVVPNAELKVTGRISKATLGKIMEGYARARNSRTLQTLLLTPEGEVVYH